MAHEFSIIGDGYVSKSGNNGNAGTDPDLPKLDIQSALGIGSTSDYIIIGTGVYEESSINLAIALRRLDTDGIVILKGDGTNNGITLGANSGHSIENLILVNFENSIIGSTSVGYRAAGIVNCKIIGGNITNLGANFGGGSFSKTFFSNVNATYRTGFTNNFSINDCFWYNSAINGMYDATTNEINDNIFVNCTIDITDEATVSKIKNCVFWNTNFVINGVAYSSMAAAKTALGGFTNCVESNPLFLGDPDKLELLVAENSPCIGQGTIGQNIGYVKTGNVQNRNSLEWGLSPESSGNTIFDSNDALTLISGTSSVRESKEIDLGQLRNRVKINMDGLFDALNNVPDSNNGLVNHNALCFEAQWAGVDKIYNGTWRQFRFNKFMRMDTSLKTTGETGYDWSNETEIAFRYLKIRTTIRDDYSNA